MFVAPRSAAAQNWLFERLNLDKLQLVSLGGSAGPIRPSQVDPTSVFSVSADYGEVSPHWRLMFGASYWQSQYRDAVVQSFLDTITRSLVDSTGAAHIQKSPITLYDVTFSLGLRWSPKTTTFLQPYVGFGLAGHVVNADGKLIRHTFVERSLDAIAAGIFSDAGLQLRIIRHFGIDAEARTDLMSSFRSYQLRAGGTYYFGHLRRPEG